MIELFSLKFWIGVLFVIDLLFILFFLMFVRRLGRRGAAKTDSIRDSRNTDESDDAAQRQRAIKSAEDIIALLEPLVLESRKAAESFESQIKDKKNLIKNINDSLDSRIISINLLMSRAESVKDKLESRQMDAVPDPSFRPKAGNYSHSNIPGDVLDQQNSIVDLYNRGFDAEAIASRLSMPRGEVKLVIDLKEKFKAMELTD